MEKEVSLPNLESRQTKNRSQNKSQIKKVTSITFIIICQTMRPIRLSKAKLFQFLFFCELEGKGRFDHTFLIPEKRMQYKL